MNPRRLPGDWRRRYARFLRGSDTLVLVWVVYGTQIAWLGFDRSVAVRGREPIIDYSVFSAILIVAWIVALELNDTRGHRVVGAGLSEYKRILDASFVLFGAIAIIAFLTRLDLARGFLLISLPIGIVMLFLERWLWRQWLRVKRENGEYSAHALLVGSKASVTQIAHELHRSPFAGYLVVGACVPAGRTADVLPGEEIPVMGDIDSVGQALETTGADTVIVTSTDDLPADKVKQISWALEAGRQHLVLAPSITDIAGPRLRTRPVSGLSLIHVETPRFTTGQRFLKRSVDLAGSVFGIVLLSPVFLLLTVLVGFTSSGPILFRQTRVGIHGREFKMLKFRSMVQNAEALLPELKKHQDAGNAVMFKMHNDPRITRIGRVMRRYSLDELPQLFNVIGGSMSLVGPRPPLRREVAQYANHVHRRFLVQPGITGLWQVSGRSTLSWEETVRLDLSYVENWSLVGDMVILLKTGRAALAPGKTTS